MELRKLHKKGLEAIAIYKRAGLSQRDVFRRAGVSEGSFNTYMYEPKKLKPSTVAKIVKVLTEIKEENK